MAAEPKTTRVLIVDDVADNVKLLAQELQDQGYHVLTASSGRRALGIASAEHPDVILLDVVMPEMDGVEVCRRLQEDAHTRTIPIILVTSTGLDENVIAGLDAGAVDYVSKPFNRHVLAARIRSALRVTESLEAVTRTNQMLREEIAYRKETEEAFHKKDEELRQALKLEAVGRLAGGIAHEFNNLLQAIGGYARMAMGSISPEETSHQDLQQILKATERAARLTRQLLDFSRHQRPDRKPVDPNEVVNNVRDMVHPIIGERVTLEAVLDDSVDLVCADAGQLAQVLVNLCLNARDAMPSGGQLTIETRNVRVDEDDQWTYGGLEPGRYVLLTVADTGCGMSAEVKERAFDPFFTTKEIGEGTGLGLATVYGIVQQHDGMILVDSTPGKGTSFRILVPATKEELPAVQHEPAKTMSWEGTETILLAEDESLVRDIAERILQSAGYSTITARNGEEAVQLFQENREAISLVLLDAMMPKLNGHEVYQRIRKDDRETPIIFCSGYDPETARSELVTEESLRMIQKPFEPGDLLSAVREVLDNRMPCQPAMAAL